MYGPRGLHCRNRKFSMAPRSHRGRRGGSSRCFSDFRSLLQGVTHGSHRRFSLAGSAWKPRPADDCQAAGGIYSIDISADCSADSVNISAGNVVIYANGSADLVDISTDCSADINADLSAGKVDISADSCADIVDICASISADY